MELSNGNVFDNGAEAPQDTESSRSEPLPAELSPAPAFDQPAAAVTLQAQPLDDATPWFRVASGIEAGIVGGLAMLALQFSESLWNGHVWWEVPNILGSTFYGPRAFRAGVGMATLGGLALHFVITGCLGALFGLAFGAVRQRGRLVMLGLAASVGWYTLANAALWPRVNPWIPVVSPRPGTVVSHVLLGACLGFMGQRSRLLTATAPAGSSDSASHYALGPALPPSGFLSPEEMPLPNAQIAAAQAAAPAETLCPEPAPPPAVASSDALE